MKKFLVAALAAFLATAAFAQNSGTVTNHAYAIGKGPGVAGYSSLLCASGQLALGSATDPTCRTMSGDATINATGVFTLATVNANVGTFGSATQAPQITLDAKGRATAATSLTITPAVGSITGLGTGVATWLAAPSSANLRGAVTDETGTGLLYFQGGDLGTPSAGVLTNATGLPVAGGGTGRASNTANAIMAAGTTATGAQQQLGLGTTTQVLHGNAAGLATFGSVVSADMNITTTSCTNQFVTAISAGGVGTCTTDTLASAQHANQGTTATVLHGNAAGNPAFGAVALATDVSGTLPFANGGTNDTGTAAGSYAPGTPACGTATITVAASRFKLLANKITWLQGDFTITVIGTCAVTNLTFNLPSTAQSAANLHGRLIANNTGINCSIAASGTIAACLRDDGATWVAGNFTFSGIYENQ